MTMRKYQRRMPETTQLSCPACGYTTQKTTVGQASRSLRLHSCTRWTEKAAASARKVERRTRSGPTRECHHRQATHRHGTASAYIRDKCRCRPCTDAAGEVWRTRARQIAYGRWQPYVDAEPARTHIRNLQAAGIGLRSIGERASVSSGAIQRLMYGRDGRGQSRRLRGDTAAAILAVTAIPAQGSCVNGVGTRRRLQALSALGWSRTLLAEHLGVSTASLSRMLLSDGAVRVSTVATCRDLYDQLWNVQPPDLTRLQRTSVTRTLKDAHARGWVLPQAWDDETIDDPAATPSGHAPGSLEFRTRDAVVAAAVDMARTGETLEAAATRIGKSAATLERTLLRAGRADVVRALNTAADVRLTSHLAEEAS